MTETDLKQLSKQFEELYSNPESYLDPPETLKRDLISTSKTLYDFMKNFESDYVSKKNSLNELLVSGFDNEQIWQEIQLQNSPCLSFLKKNLNALTVSNIALTSSDISAKEKISKKKKKSNDDKKGRRSRGHNDKNNSKHDEEIEEMNSSEDESDSESIKPKKYKSTVVDDNFFKLRQMEDFLDQQDRQEELRLNGELKVSEDEEIDLFTAMNDDKSVTGLKYKDYFDPPPQTKGGIDKNKNKAGLLEEDYADVLTDEEYAEDVNGAAEMDENDCTNVAGENDENDDSVDEKDEEEEDDEEQQSKSKFEENQEVMDRKIKRLEEANLAKKPWQLLGESTSKHRPMNSLLEEHVSYDHTSVGAPVITEETTESLEDIIKQRIKDEAWDDVQRKLKPTTQPFEYKKAPELNQEKSKLSLAEVYEKEYLKQAEDDKEEKESEEHISIKNLMDKLFVQLDSLSNFHFTPKPPRPEIKIITNTPSLQMEEVTPVTATEASQLAPEEIYDKKKEDVKGATEKTDGERKHERRQKKIKKKFAAKERERKEKIKVNSGKVSKSSNKQAINQLKKGTRNTIVNEKHSSEKGVKSSNVFFNKLQDEVKRNITKQKSTNGKENKQTKKKVAEFLKL